MQNIIIITSAVQCQLDCLKSLMEWKHNLAYFSVWKIAEPSRVEVLERMVVALDRWDINTKRNINYRSFEPILRLVKVVHTPQCQHWAAWALANLTRTDGMIQIYIDQSYEKDFIVFTFTTEWLLSIYIFGLSFDEL